MSKTYYHGSHKGELVLHIGLCLTSSESSADNYAGRNGAVAVVEMDMTGLTVLTVAGYDRDADTAAGDAGAAQYAGVDVLLYDDEDTHNRQHDTVRLMSQAALARVMMMEIK